MGNTPHIEKPKWLCYDQKTAELTEDERALREENLAARSNFSENGMRRLAANICLSAIREYRKSKRKLAALKGVVEAIENGYPRVSSKTRLEIAYLQASVKECEEFFGSDLFAECTGICDPEEAIRKIDKISSAEEMLMGRMIGAMDRASAMII